VSRTPRTGRSLAAAVMSILMLSAGLFLAASSAAGAAGLNWSTMPGPTPPVPGGALIALSCASAQFCMSVGPYDTAEGPTSSVEWGGSSWSQVSIPENEDLGGVSCLSRTFCMAVGGDKASGLPLAYEWNGSSWSGLALPSTATGQLVGVSCVSTTDCEAAGISGNGQSLTARWHGQKWSLQASPSPDTINWFFSVSCTSATFCVATGQGETGTVESSLIEQWNGSAWTVVPSPNPGNADYLPSVSCTSPAFCAAVGFTGDPSDWAPLVETWNGSTWSTATVPAVAAPAQLAGVDCYRPTTCLATGWAGADNLVLKLGSSGTWTVQSAPASSPGTSSALAPVSCVKGWACVTAGLQFLNDPGTTFFAETPLGHSA
jgi:hypothetical protein